MVDERHDLREAIKSARSALQLLRSVVPIHSFDALGWFEMAVLDIERAVGILDGDSQIKKFGS